MPEFDLIRQLQQIIDVPVAPGRGRVVHGIGDDAAVVAMPGDRELVVCVDTLVEDIHFPAGTDPASVGHKSLAVNLSDLAAMGAEPAWFLLSLALPEGDPEWVGAFAGGMAALAARSGIALVGGDTTSGDRCITVTAAGLVEPGGAMLRSGAQAGDLVYVSGCPGMAALALRQLQSGQVADSFCLRALEYPEPRLDLGRAIRGLATACIDISDGLAADLGHVLENSGVGVTLDLAALPAVPQLAALPDEPRWSLQLAGGDDYELCFTAKPESAAILDSVAAELGVALTAIGKVYEGSELVLNRPGGGVFEIDSPGYQHFGSVGESGE